MPMVLMNDAWLNIKANELAKQKLDPWWEGPRTYRLLGEGWLCTIHQDHITKNLSEGIHTHINGLPAQKHWKKKFKVADPIWDHVDWNGLEQAYQESTKTVQCWAAKYMSVFCHGQNMMQWQYHLALNCLQCGLLEDNAHITCCQQDSATNKWQVECDSEKAQAMVLGK